MKHHKAADLFKQKQLWHFAKDAPAIAAEILLLVSAFAGAVEHVYQYDEDGWPKEYEQACAEAGLPPQYHEFGEQGLLALLAHLGWKNISPVIGPNHLWYTNIGDELIGVAFTNHTDGYTPAAIYVVVPA